MMLSTGHYTAVGANTVVMPGNVVPEGCTIGASSFVPPRFELRPWTVYAGAPVRPVADRNRDSVLAQVEQIRRFLAERGDA